MTIARDIIYIGVNDHNIDLFEGLYPVPNGMSYNSYIIMDEKIAIMDTVDEGFSKQWLENIRMALKEKKPDYLIVQHMEPDHSANILKLLDEYPKTTLVATAKAFTMMKNYFGREFEENRIVVTDGDSLKLGRHELVFVTAPMVHWPEVLVTYDSTHKILFSADSFGRFGALDLELDWLDEARRYYFGIVGKYGLWVQKLFKKLEDMEIRMICPLHGPVLSEDIMYYMKMYNIWSSYKPEEDGIMIAYTSVYGNTKRAVKLLEMRLKEKGCKKVVVLDLARCDMTEAVAEAFRYSKLVLATTTYNAEIFPPMREFLNCLTERFFGNRVVGIIENGSWAPIVAKLIKEKLEKSKGIVFADTVVRMVSALNDDSLEQLELMAGELCRNYELV
ncbi:MAG: FprA family A-type flavoprotein [Lachnospiraceae bacterium]|nr:FprA family A-type flavoprotein [Lachnospiraceae bacterium]